MQKKHKEQTEPTESYKLNPLEDLFKSDPLEVAKEIENKEENSENDVPVVKKKQKKIGFKTKKLQKVRANKLKKPVG